MFNSVALALGSSAFGAFFNTSLTLQTELRRRLRRLVIRQYVLAVLLLGEPAKINLIQIRFRSGVFIRADCGWFGIMVVVHAVIERERLQVFGHVMVAQNLRFRWIGVVIEHYRYCKENIR